jgi:hypothetical protein
MPVRDCPTHQPIYAYAFESDTSGADLSIGSLQSACNVYAGMSGSTAWAGDGALHFCGGLRHHRVKLFNQNADGSLTTLCAGSDPKSGFLCSSDWNSDLSTSPQPTNTTRCTVPGAQAPRTQFSTDGGRHFGACDNRDLVAFSLGQGN